MEMNMFFQFKHESYYAVVIVVKNQRGRKTGVTCSQLEYRSIDQEEASVHFEQLELGR